MNYPDVELYKELVTFCNKNQEKIEKKFKVSLEFNQFHEECFVEMYLTNRQNEEPLKPAELKKIIPGLTEVYKEIAEKFWKRRNEMIKGLDIQKGQWFEKALQMFLATKEIIVSKKGYPYPDFVVLQNEIPKVYYELKYIEAPFISANNLIKNPFPYNTSRWDYEASLTLDTGEKLSGQREKYCQEIQPSNVPFYYVWWFDAPHLKGIFYMKAEDVYEYWDKVGTLHQRKQRKGDILDKQEKGKIYPPLLKMESLDSLIHFLL